MNLKECGILATCLAFGSIAEAAAPDTCYYFLAGKIVGRSVLSSRGADLNFFGTPSGTAIRYYGNDSARGRKIEARLENGRLVHTTAYDEAGHKVAESDMDGQVPHGDHLFFHPNGKVFRRSFLDSGKVEGAAETFNDSGILIRKDFYRKGKLNGSVTTWYSSGVKESELRYMEGVREGESLFWYPNGNLMAKASYRNDHPDGKWTEYFESGEKKHDMILDYYEIVKMTCFDEKRRTKACDYRRSRQGAFDEIKAKIPRKLPG